MYLLLYPYIHKNKYIDYQFVYYIFVCLFVCLLLTQKTHKQNIKCYINKTNKQTNIMQY